MAVQNGSKIYERHYEDNRLIPAGAEEVFAFIDDHASFSSHMNESSWMTGGGKMTTSIDAGRGQKIGSHIRMSGKAFGITVSLDEVVTVHQSPKIKEWETVGKPKLLVIGPYRMGVRIVPQENDSQLTVSIDYDLPSKNVWLGKLFGGIYAKWCVEQMIRGASEHFNKGLKNN